QDVAREIDAGKLLIESRDPKPVAVPREIMLHGSVHAGHHLRDAAAEQGEQRLDSGGNNERVPEATLFDELTGPCQRGFLDKLQHLARPVTVAAAGQDIPELRVRRLRLDAQQYRFIRTPAQPLSRHTQRADQNRLPANVMIRRQQHYASLRITLSDMQQWQENSNSRATVRRLHDYILAEQSFKLRFPPAPVLLRHDGTDMSGYGHRPRPTDRFTQ